MTTAPPGTSSAPVSATVPIYNDPPPSLGYIANNEGCFNFNTTPVATSEIYPVGDPLHNTNLLSAGSGGNTSAGVPQQSHGIRFSLTCDNANGDCPDLTSGPLTGMFVSDYKLRTIVNNMTTGRRVVQLGDFAHQMLSMSQVYVPSSPGAVDFWGSGSGSTFTAIERSVSQLPPTSINVSFSSGIPGFSADFMTLPGRHLASKPRFLWDYVDDISNSNQPKTDLINNAQSGIYYSDSSGNVAFTQDLRIKFATGYGTIISGHDLQVKVGCTDPNANNYCPTCNAMQKFSQYSTGQVVSSNNWTIWDY